MTDRWGSSRTLIFSLIWHAASLLLLARLRPPLIIAFILMMLWGGAAKH